MFQAEEDDSEIKMGDYVIYYTNTQGTLVYNHDSSWDRLTQMLARETIFVKKEPVNNFEALKVLTKR